MARFELPYDYEDFGMNQTELMNKYGESGHPEYTLEAWGTPSNDTGTITTYWDWVIHMIAEDDKEMDAADTELPIEDLDHFVTILVDWHQRQVATVEHMQHIPAGTDIRVEGEEDLTLEGKTLTAFKMGLSIGLTCLGTLPFNAEFVDPDATKH